MFLAGMSFPLIWISIYRRPLEWVRDGEFRFYFLACGSTALALAFILSGDHLTLENFRYGLFQCASLISSTGYAQGIPDHHKNIFMDCHPIHLRSDGSRIMETEKKPLLVRLARIVDHPGYGSWCNGWDVGFDARA